MIKTSKEFIDILNQYDSKNKYQQNLLKRLTEEYSYFVVPFLYLLKSNKALNINEYDSILEQTAIRVFDRTTLYHWVYPKKKEEKTEIVNNNYKKNKQEAKEINKVTFNSNYKEWGEKIQKTIKKIKKLQEKKSASKNQNKKREKKMPILLNIIQNELKMIEGKLDTIEKNQDKKSAGIVINNNTGNISSKNKNDTLEKQVSPSEGFSSDEINEKHTLNEKNTLLEDAQQKAIDVIKNIKQKGFFTKKSLGIKESASNGEKDNEKEENSLEEKENEKNSLEEKIKLIDDFIKKNPRVEPASSEGNLSTNSIVESKFNKESLMTETLAILYFEQNKYNDAIQAYKILSLKYPQKKSFFANKIKEIKKIKQSSD